MKRILLCLVFVGGFISATAQALDLLLTNGKFYTVNPDQPWAEAMGIEGDRISFIGSNQDAAALVGGAKKVVNLKGKLVLPGLHDVHTHPLEAANPAGAACILRIGMDPEKEISNIKRCAKYQRGTDWVLGWGYSIYDLLDTQRPPKTILDQAIPDKPALFMDFTSHSMWANSKALEVAKIDINTPNPVGGVIVRDEETGEASGLLLDNAGNMVMELAFAPNQELLDLAYSGLLHKLRDLGKNGLTSIVDARTYWTRNHHQVWQKLADDNKLSARVLLSLWAYPDKDHSQIDEIKQLFQNDPDSLLRMSQVKVYMDGIVENTTAAMKAPYVEDLGWIEGNRGLNYFDQLRLTKYIFELGEAGFDFLIHAIGDRGAHEALNAIEAASEMAISETGKNRRHRITHLEIVDEVDIPRFKQLNVIADFQVAGEWSHPEVYGESEVLIGEKAFNPIPVKSIFETGAVVTLSSDYDVSTMNPFVAMENALDRGNESLDNVGQVIRAYTINAAYSMRQENQTGSLETGKFADLIIVNQNLFEIPNGEISSTRVLVTVLGGRVVYGGW